MVYFILFFILFLYFLLFIAFYFFITLHCFAFYFIVLHCVFNLIYFLHLFYLFHIFYFIFVFILFILLRFYYITLLSILFHFILFYLHCAGSCFIFKFYYLIYFCFILHCIALQWFFILFYFLWFVSVKPIKHLKTEFKGCTSCGGSGACDCATVCVCVCESSLFLSVVSDAIMNDVYSLIWQHDLQRSCVYIRRPPPSHRTNDGAVAIRAERPSDGFIWPAVAIVTEFESDRVWTEWKRPMNDSVSAQL